MKDSAAHLDHLNGKRHNALLGISNKVERVTVDRIREKLLLAKRKDNTPIENLEDFERKFEEEEKQKKEQALKESRKKKKLKDENEEIEAKLREDGDLLMDFPMSFGSSRK
eukprot:TRINITY_DN1151_c0_g2_i2.p2 TRINITY_DN1151_c0_g2~~TRINITY_DN1151_c0_g2_i2.p2  ORF type:complete len:111 (+),score=39.97 TRINITY_DN1151_c0_g2_i2:424-756(+)